MKLYTTLPVSILLLTRISIAHSDTTSRKLALGMEASESDLPGITLLYKFSDSFALQLRLGAAWKRDKIERPIASTSDSTSMSTLLRVHWSPVQYEKLRIGTALGLGFQGEFGGIDANMTTSDHNQLRLRAEVGLRPEWFITERLSLHSQIGFAYLYSDGNVGRTQMRLGLETNIVGQAGLSLWF